jgi:hypothetical protein
MDVLEEIPHIKTIEDALAYLYYGKVVCRIPDQPKIKSLYTSLGRLHGFTQKQRDMIVDIVHRYRKQYRKKFSFDIVPLTKEPVWSSELRPPVRHRTSCIDYDAERNIFILDVIYNKEFNIKLRSMKKVGFYYDFVIYDIPNHHWHIPASDDGAEVVRAICDWLHTREVPIPYTLTGAAYERVHRPRKPLPTGVLSVGAYRKIVLKSSASRNQERYAESVFARFKTEYQQLNKLVIALMRN